MNTEWWNEEPSVAAFVFESSSVCTAALLSDTNNWVISEAKYDPPACTWTCASVCPEHAQAIAVWQDESRRAALWRKSLLTPLSPTDWLPRPDFYFRAETVTGQETECIVVDRSVALAFCALSFPAVRKRSQRQGVTAIHIGTKRLTVFLIFQNKLFGVFEHISALPEEQLLDDLKEFRLGWLPDEVVRAQGGYGAALSDSMPPQAEGFVPTFLFGRPGTLLTGHGKLLVPSMEEGWAECRGLLYGLAMQKNSSSCHL